MVTAMTVATRATTVAVAGTKTMEATVMAGGTDNNQLEAAADEPAGAAATETAMGTEMVTVTVMTMTPMPTPTPTLTPMMVH